MNNVAAKSNTSFQELHDTFCASSVTILVEGRRVGPENLFHLFEKISMGSFCCVC